MIEETLQLNGERLKPFFYIRTKTRVPTLITHIQHSTGSPRQSNSENK